MDATTDKEKDMGLVWRNSGLAGLLLATTMLLAGCRGTLSVSGGDAAASSDPYGVVTTEDLEGSPRESLVELMGSDLPWTRLSAAQVLAKDGRASVPTFLERLDHPDWRVVRAAQDGIQAVLTAAEKGEVEDAAAIHDAVVAGIPALTRTLKHEHYYVRMGALKCLGALGADAAPAGNAICDATEDEDYLGVIPTAFKTIQEVGPANFKQDRLFVVMENSVKSLHIDARQAAINLIQKLDEADQRKLVPAMLYALDHELNDGYTRYHVQAQIARLLQKLEVKETLPRIVAILGIKGWGESHRIKQLMPLLAKYGPEAAEALPFLEDYVKIFEKRGTNSDLIVLIREAITAIKDGQGDGGQKS